MMNKARMPLTALLVRLILGIVTVLSSGSVHAQSGMPFAEFAPKLLVYYDSAMVSDVRDRLPQEIPFRVWGWDVGDYSGDGNFDVAFTIRRADNRERGVTVYLFVDIDGFLQCVGTYDYTFVDTPLEVGMVIKNNACYVTRKRREFEWTVQGYRFTEGNLVLMDEFASTRLERFAKESYRNFLTLDHETSYLYPSSGDVAFVSRYKMLPCYTRGRSIYRSTPSQSDISTVAFVQRGAFMWTGPDDASMSIKSVYDSAGIYLTVAVHDDTIVIPRCDTCAGDALDVWFDTSDPGDDNDRVLGKRGRRSFVRKSADDGLYRLGIRLGDFALRAPQVVMSTTDSVNADSIGVAGIPSITAKTALRENGYVVRLRIPFAAIGIRAREIGLSKAKEIGCTVVLHDIDNEFRPEEESTIATSELVDMNPATFGILRFIPDDESYGTVAPVFTSAVCTYLRTLGF
ncbi:MAG: hypothetical protein ACKOBV_00390 [Candidatus Kapaibacterium sp.]